MNINHISPITFGKLSMHRRNGLKFPNDFLCISSNNTPYNITIREEYGAYQVYFLPGTDDEPHAEQEINIYQGQDYMSVDNMYTNTESRKEGLGSCMHLINIIEMLENNIKRIELLAVASAIPFHSKLGFKPYNNWEYLSLRQNILQIANDNSPEMETESKLASQLLKAYYTPDLKAKLGNKLLYNYIQKALKIKTKEEQKSMFKHPLFMVLSRKDVLKNKEFYNKLFNKYGIDYQITDSSD